MEEKKALYFAAGAQEVWFCAGDGKMTFFVEQMGQEKAWTLSIFHGKRY